MTGRSRAQRKAAAYLRAKLSLKHAVERIDYDFDVIAPKLAEIRALETTQNVEIEAVLEEVGPGNQREDEYGARFE